MKRLHRTYHPYFKYLVLFQDPHNEFKSMIPKSTYHHWVKYGTGFYFGQEHAVELSAEQIQVFRQFSSSSRLYKFLQAALVANEFFKKLIRQLTAPRKLNQQYRQQILDCLSELKTKVSQTDALKLLGKSKHFLAHAPHVATCHTSAFNRCFKRHPLQLTTKEQQAIKAYLTDAVMGQWQKVSVFWQPKKDNVLHCSKSTFYRYAARMGFGGFAKRKRKMNSKFPKAKKKLEIVHMDTSHFPIGNQRFYIYLVVDNYTRAILAHRLETVCNSKFALLNLLSAIKRFKHLYFLITDGGPENRGHVSRFLNLRKVSMNRKIAWSDLYTTNATVELVIKQLKSFHIRTNGNETLDQARRILDQAVDQYMNKPLDVHSGLSAKECLNDVQVDFELRTAIEEKAKEVRIKENRTNGCGICET